ncbi:MAG TPA: winged helix-turn-helix domain-containing protein, partial [Pyrinomonadaceae bacterium]
MRDELRVDFRVEGRLVQTRLNRVVSADGGKVVQVQPKIMDVLVRLAERPGEVVTREELFSTVWAGTHVTEHVLARAISELRKVFDDSAQKPRVIETIPKVGYRLIASVTAA